MKGSSVEKAACIPVILVYTYIYMYTSLPHLTSSLLCARLSPAILAECFPETTLRRARTLRDPSSFHCRFSTSFLPVFRGAASSTSFFPSCLTRGLGRPRPSTAPTPTRAAIPVPALSLSLSLTP